ncbi:MAG: FHA domain-containing protein [Phycisphaerales bacterium]|nr:FHA domain-containing protein [Phycisphaerales bacterium]
MPTLIIQQPDGQVGCRFDGRLLVGRRLTNDIIINDVAVSRIHAWFDGDKDRYYVADNSSRTGLKLNGKPATGRIQLADGDQVEIGPSRITFHTSDQLPEGLLTLDRGGPAEVDGTLFNCECGAPLWVSPNHAKSKGRCAHCGRSVRIPQSIPQARPVMVASAGQTACGICQCVILPAEQVTCCPSCQHVYHAECWVENQGCAAYGCDQVNILAGPQATAPTTMDHDPVPVDSHHWPLLLLASSLFAAVLGMFTFGLTALVTGLIDGIYLVRTRQHRKLAAGALLISLVGLAAGLVFSYSFWLRRSLWSMR